MPDNKASRTLTIGDRDFALDGDKVADLFERRIVYECGGEHDLHLDPSILFFDPEITALLDAHQGAK